MVNINPVSSSASSRWKSPLLSFAEGRDREKRRERGRQRQMETETERDDCQSLNCSDWKLQEVFFAVWLQQDYITRGQKIYCRWWRGFMSQETNRFTDLVKPSQEDGTRLHESFRSHVTRSFEGKILPRTPRCKMERRKVVVVKMGCEMKIGTGRKSSSLGK